MRHLIFDTRFRQTKSSVISLLLHEANFAVLQSKYEHGYAIQRPEVANKICFIALARWHIHFNVISLEI